MRAPLKVRLLTIPLVILPALAGLWLYVSTRDWEHLRRQFELGHDLTFPPRAKPGPTPEAIDDVAQHDRDRPARRCSSSRSRSPC